jgi:DNA-directed RNA polymerase subunit RPC12/RpoP
MTGDMHQFQCDQCGRTFHEFEFVETIEEMLCQYCASGIEEDDDFDDDGIEDGYDG